MAGGLMVSCTREPPEYVIDAPPGQISNNLGKFYFEFPDGKDLIKEYSTEFCFS
jgi:hypothetical protein